MTTDAGDMLPLPGLDDPRAGEPALVLAARRSIAAVADDLDDSHALTLQLVLELSRVVAASASSGKASAAALAAGQLREAWASLPLDDEAGGDAYDQLAAELRDAAREGAAAVRDAARLHGAD